MSQQDVAEILQNVLDELNEVSLVSSSLISNIQRPYSKTEVPYNTCPCSSVSKENLNIQPPQVSTDIQTSPNQFLHPEI